MPGHPADDLSGLKEGRLVVVSVSVDKGHCLALSGSHGDSMEELEY